VLLLTSTSDLVQLVTGAAATVKVHASYVDYASGVQTPGRNNPASIATATTTTIVGSPAASTQRNVKHLNIMNTHASASCQVTVIHTDGTNASEMVTCTLLPSETLTFEDGTGWEHSDAQGAFYTYAGPSLTNLGATGTLAETMPREICPEVNTAVGASGTMFMQAIYLKAGTLVSAISLWSATTAAGTPTNYWAALYSSALALLAQSANQTTTAWAANSKTTFNMTTAYRVPTSGLYYIGFMMTATTVVTLKGGTAKTGGQLAAATPAIAGTSTTGLTTTPPSTAGAITGGTATIYGAVS